MPLLSPQIDSTLDQWNFVREFWTHEYAYLGLATAVAQDFLNTCKQVGATVQLQPLEDFADIHLVPHVTMWLVSDTPFVYFRQALKSGRRKYINPVDYWAWGEMMARYVLQEAIRRRVLL